MARWYQGRATTPAMDAVIDSQYLHLHEQQYLLDVLGDRAYPGTGWHYQVTTISPDQILAQMNDARRLFMQNLLSAPDVAAAVRAYTPLNANFTGNIFPHLDEDGAHIGQFPPGRYVQGVLVDPIPYYTPADVAAEKQANIAAQATAAVEQLQKQITAEVQRLPIEPVVFYDPVVQQPHPDVETGPEKVIADVVSPAVVQKSPITAESPGLPDVLQTSAPAVVQVQAPEQKDIKSLVPWISLALLIFGDK